jgi:signal peptidase I
VRRRAWIAAAVVVAALLGARLLVAEPFRVPTGSMLPTLGPGDQVLVDKLAHHPRRGDLVVFTRPRTGEILLKRVVALGGDTVAIQDGALYVDGRRAREPYADPRAIDSVYFGPVRVPRGSVFALGDNRADSLDSRAFGAIAETRIIGRVVARIWPPDRLGKVS